jgi:hypothetical protein
VLDTVVEVQLAGGKAFAELSINPEFIGLMYQPPPEQDGIRSIMPPGRGFRISR